MDLTPRRLGLQALDAVVYAAVLSGALVVGTVPLSVAAGLGMTGVKWALFVSGFAMLAYATMRLKPARPDERADGDDEGNRERNDGSEGRQRYRGGADGAKATVGSVHRLVGDSLPARLRLPPDDRLSSGTKLFVAAVGVLLTSYLMEAVFGVGG